MSNHQSTGNMFVAVVLVTVCLASSTVLAKFDKPYYEVEEAEEIFKEYVKEHNKVYNRGEYYERLEIFKENLKDINERNEMFPNTAFAVNHFADLKPQELQHYFGFKPSNETIRKVKIRHGLMPVPEEFDWRNKSVVSHVKNQGQCGSCYIFSAIGNIEGQYAIKHGQCLALSEGQALDCLECGGCGGGDMGEVMGELTKKTLEKEVDYAYKPVKSYCHEDGKKGVVQVTGEVTYLDTSDEEALKSYLVHIGPLSIAINSMDFLFYSGGILEPHKCKYLPSDHAVLLVGYGEENNRKFWTIKNSWGEKTGEKGYVRLLRGVKACEIGSYTVTTTVI